jgi:hypothetical protein
LDTLFGNLSPYRQTLSINRKTLLKSQHQICAIGADGEHNALLKFAGVPVERNGGSRTLYSLRHFYATMRMSNDTSPFLLAKQMGTSVEMLEKFYGQTVSSALAARISKGNQTVGDGNGKVYPFG